MSNIVLLKKQTNEIAVTLGERVKLLNPFFLFVFSNKFDAQKKVCAVENLAQNKRFNLIRIIEKTNPNPLIGEVQLVEGEWSYMVYESEEKTIEISETTGEILQKGLALIK